MLTAKFWPFGLRVCVCACLCGSHSQDVPRAGKIRITRHRLSSCVPLPNRLKCSCLLPLNRQRNKPRPPTERPANGVVAVSGCGLLLGIFSVRNENTVTGSCAEELRRRERGRTRRIVSGWCDRGEEHTVFQRWRWEQGFSGNVRLA